MTETFEAEELSAEQPGGHPNGWPIADYLAVVAVYERSVELAEAFCGIVDERDGRARRRLFEAAVTQSLVERGLPGDHWLRDNALAGFFGLFRTTTDGRLRDAGPFLRFLDERDADKYRDLVQWAWRLSDTEPN